MTINLVTNIPKNENNLLDFGLDELARLGAKRILTQALQLEVEEYVEALKELRDESGKRLVVRNGSSRPRKVTLGSGTIEVKAPRVNDRRSGQKFESKILPPYLRKSPNVESVLPLLYLKGLSGNAFYEALRGLLGDNAAGLSSSTISYLKKDWERELKEWSKRDLLEDYVYIWCDGVNVEVRLGEDKRACLLVVIGVNTKGEKKLLAVQAGYRESKAAWKMLFSDLESRGFKSPLLVVGDGALGLWGCVKEMELFKETKEQRCWVHKIANVLEKLPKKLQPQAKALLHEMMRSTSAGESHRQKKIFKETFNDKYPKSVECLEKDWDKLTSYLNFPAAQWTSLRTTNPIESAFASVKLRTSVTKGAGTASMAEAMSFKLLKECEKSWRLIRGHQEIEKQLQGAIYKDGVLVESAGDQDGVA